MRLASSAVEVVSVEEECKIRELDIPSLNLDFPGDIPEQEIVECLLGMLVVFASEGEVLFPVSTSVSCCHFRFSAVFPPTHARAQKYALSCTLTYLLFCRMPHAEFLGRACSGRDQELGVCLAVVATNIAGMVHHGSPAILRFGHSPQVLFREHSQDCRGYLRGGSL